MDRIKEIEKEIKEIKKQLEFCFSIEFRPVLEKDLELLQNELSFLKKEKK